MVDVPAVLRKRQQTPNLEIGRLDNVTLKAIVMYVHVTYPAAQLPWPEPPCAVHSLDVRHVPFRNAVDLKLENKFSTKSWVAARVHLPTGKAAGGLAWVVGEGNHGEEREY